MSSEKPPLTLTREQVHDLRAALGAISMASEAIASNLPEGSRSWVEMIKANAEKSLKILGSEVC